MIAASSALAHDKPSKPVAPDARRSYDRGVWVAEAHDVDADPRAGGRPAASDDPEFDLASVSTAEIKAELRRRDSTLARLIQQRKRVAEELARIEREIRDIEVAPPVARVSERRATRAPGAHVRLALRPQNSLSLSDAIAAEIEPGETVTPAEVAKRVLRNGYQTTASNFPLLVNGTLRKHEGFQRVARGQYRRQP